jgi:hypothetical protein
MKKVLVVMRKVGYRPGLIVSTAKKIQNLFPEHTHTLVGQLDQQLDGVGTTEARANIGTNAPLPQTSQHVVPVSVLWPNFQLFALIILFFPASPLDHQGDTDNVIDAGNSHPVDDTLVEDSVPALVVGVVKTHHFVNRSIRIKGSDSSRTAHTGLKIDITGEGCIVRFVIRVSDGRNQDRWKRGEQVLRVGLGFGEHSLGWRSDGGGKQIS